MKVLKKLTTAVTAVALGVMTLATTGVLAKNVKTIASTATQVERDKEREIFADLLSASVVADDDIVELDNESFGLIQMYLRVLYNWKIIDTSKNRKKSFSKQK